MIEKNKKTLGIIWVCTGLSFLMLVFLSYSISNVAQKKECRSNFYTNRLKRIQSHGVVLIGTSLVKAGCAFDQDLDLVSQKQGMPIEFVRFSLSRGNPKEFVPLLCPILKAKPKWVFIQIEPFLWNQNQHDSLQGNLYRLINIGKHICGDSDYTIYGDYRRDIYEQEQNDSEVFLNLKREANSLLPTNPRLYFWPQFPEEYKIFFKKAKDLDINIVLLQMNRSISANIILGQKFEEQQYARMHAFADSNRLPLWQFQSLPFSYYSDGYHLNGKGRLVFETWLIQHIQKESAPHV